MRALTTSYLALFASFFAAAAAALSILRARACVCLNQRSARIPVLCLCLVFLLGVADANLLSHQICYRLICVCFVVVVFPIDSDVWFGRICASSHRSGSARTDAHRAQHSHHFCVLIGLAYKMSVSV